MKLIYLFLLFATLTQAFVKHTEYIGWDELDGIHKDRFNRFWGVWKEEYAKYWDEQTFDKQQNWSKDKFNESTTIGGSSLTVLRFGSGGVAAGPYIAKTQSQDKRPMPRVGSCAAAWQSVIGNVSAGSVFAFLQSSGTCGAGLFTLQTYAMAGSVVIAGTCLNSVWSPEHPEISEVLEKKNEEWSPNGSHTGAWFQPYGALPTHSRVSLSMII
ncbi:hypothetical protein BCR34DRAFT_606268 [Clohesyomyces aquaticus]|uniref:Uncharacterized protein n=1 Tax=Clohesyomyces aquaticus TaxID=1231657 RepID=A0A1Y1YRJ0_9PLEO|nr:hypothetical protein BCR34DRAFT_606268 [Clohesyomyces aquaticus]